LNSLTVWLLHQHDCIVDIMSLVNSWTIYLVINAITNVWVIWRKITLVLIHCLIIIYIGSATFQSVSFVSFAELYSQFIHYSWMWLILQLSSVSNLIFSHFKFFVRNLKFKLWNFWMIDVIFKLMGIRFLFLIFFENILKFFDWDFIEMLLNSVIPI